jgi:putative PLP-dependent aminotransferase (TIGR04422 family)
MNEEDYQWPTGLIPPPEKYTSGDTASREALQDELESFFSLQWGEDVVIVPSGRAAISLALYMENIGREHIIFAPQWSSHCVWNIVGKYANPTCFYINSIDVAIVVHKYAQTQLVPSKCRSIIIEDSCDSLISETGYLFPNNGSYEIFSLPKIMGLYSGGLLFIRDKSKVEQAKILTRRFSELNAKQNKLRLTLAAGNTKVYPLWDAGEHKNFCPDWGMLRHLKEHLEALGRNKKVILQRLKLLDSLLSPEKYRPLPSYKKRSPPVITVKSVPQKNGLMRRYVNLANSMVKPKFEQHALMPVHYGVNDDAFYTLLETILR